MKFALSPLSFAVLTILTVTTNANESTTHIKYSKNSPFVPLNIITVHATEKNDVGKTVYSKEDLEKIPNSKKTITDFLRVNPNVQFSNNSMNAGTQGNLTPSEISINGSLSYNNAFMMDGININNQINPFGTSSVNNSNELMGTSQQANINTDLICELEVLDSNVSAAYGSFSGGVVSAKTCAPQTEVGKVHGHISYDYENASWNRYNFYSSDEQAKYDAQSDASYQQDYFKQGLSATAYGRLSENLGFNAYASRRTSDIKLQPKLMADKNYDQSRQSDNLGLDLYYQASEKSELQLSLQHFESNDLYFQNNVLHSGFDMINNSDNVTIKIKQDLPSVKLEQSFNYQKKDSSRNSDSDASVSWYSSPDKNWSTTSVATEGDSGSIAQEQKKFAYKIDAEFNPIQVNNWKHTFIMGAGFTHDEANWHRPTDHYGAGIQKMGYGTDCIRDDGSLDTRCDPSYSKGALTGQYHTQYTLDPSATINVRQDSWNAYLENKVEWKKYISGTLGARFDYDSLTKNSNVAPRSSLNLMPFGDKRLTLSAGWNRYYSSNPFTFQLQDGINNLDESYARDDINSPWVQIPSTTAVNVQRSELNTPFSDEAVAALSSELHNWKYQLKYVHRNYRDEIRLTSILETADLYDRIYDNVGKSKADVVTFAISNMSPFHLMGAKHNLSLGVDYTDVMRNFNNYDVSTLNEDMYVLHDGKIMLNTSRPAVNYNQPLTARLAWDFELNRLPLKVSNLFTYRAGYDYYSRTTLPTADRIEHDGYTIRYSYAQEKTPSRFNWNIRTTYDLEISPSQKIILGLTVNNVLNKSQKYIQTSDSDSVTTGTELGRQFIADITFKF